MRFHSASAHPGRGKHPPPGVVGVLPSKPTLSMGVCFKVFIDYSHYDAETRNGIPIRMASRLSTGVVLEPFPSAVRVIISYTSAPGRRIRWGRTAACSERSVGAGPAGDPALVIPLGQAICQQLAAFSAAGETLGCATPLGETLPASAPPLPVGKRFDQR